MATRLPDLPESVRVGAVLAAVVAFGAVFVTGTVIQSDLAAEPPQPPGAPQSVASLQAQRILERAILNMEGRRSVSAKVRQSIDLFGKQPLGVGVYLEQRSESGLLFRMEMRSQAGSEPSILTVVCDGPHLWSYRAFGKEGAEEQTLERVDVLRVARALEDAGRMPRPGAIGDWPGLGGLDRLLRGLRGAFQFDAVEQIQLRQQMPVWRLSGQWRGVGGEEADTAPAEPPDVKSLPTQVPPRVAIYLGQEDLFPYRIEYLGDGGSGPARSTRPLVTIDFYEVSLNVAIPPTRFIYKPGGLEYTDETKAFLRRMGVGKESEK